MLTSEHSCVDGRTTTDIGMWTADQQGFDVRFEECCHAAAVGRQS